MIKKWDDLPKFMRTAAVRPYYDNLKKKRASLALKRCFDFLAATAILILLLPAFVVISVLIVRDSKGGVFYCQERITQYGRRFKIFKFRTMVADADKAGERVTVRNDRRITKVGAALRKLHLDELPQLMNIILGDMSFCGTRPERPYYVKHYTEEMLATLLLPAGVTSEASIRYKDEAELLGQNGDVDEIYMKKILPEKMKCNLKSVMDFSLVKEIQVIGRTVLAVLG